MRFLRSYLPAKGTANAPERSLDKPTEPCEVTEILTETPEEHHDKTNVEVEVKDLFHKAALAVKTSQTAGDGRVPKRDISLLKKLMRRKSRLHALDDLSSRVRQTLQRDATVATTAPAESDNEIGQVLTLELASDRGYDSDAHCISTPRVSEQIYEVFHGSGDVHDQICRNARRHATSEPSDPFQSAEDRGSMGESHKSSASPQRSSSLWVPKRRTAKDSSPLQTYCHSLCAADVMKEHECSARDVETTLFQHSTTHSKFTEMFEPGRSGKPVLARDPNTEEVRKVSVGWMSDGRRFGYGYSFVHNNDTVNMPSDRDESNTEFTNHDRDQSRHPVVHVDAVEDRDQVRGVEQHDGLHDERPPIDVDQSPDCNGANPSWSIFPSHTRPGRNASATFEDGVIARDFCIKASPDLPMQEGDAEEEKKRHLIPGILHRGFFNVLLGIMGLGRREIPRYQTGMQVDAARSYSPVNPDLEIDIPHWSHTPKEGLGNHYIETWRATNRKTHRRRVVTEEPQMREPQAKGRRQQSLRPLRSTRLS